MVSHGAGLYLKKSLISQLHLVSEPCSVCSNWNLGCGLSTSGHSPVFLTLLPLGTAINRVLLYSFK